MDYIFTDISKMIDHSLLNPVMTDEDLIRECELAVKYNVATICIKPYYLRQSIKLLAGSDVLPTTTVGFPHGGHTTAMKVAEAEEAMQHGARELDMVVNIGKVLSGDWDYVRTDIKAVIQVSHAGDTPVKVIFENCYLNDTQKIRLCEICGDIGADWVKTSTGYGGGGATIEDLKLMRQKSPAHVQVKAAGGVHDLDKLLEVRAVGVTRIGASRTAKILEECKQRLEI